MLSYTRMQKIIISITSNIQFDQRVIRIASALHEEGHDVTVIYRHKRTQKAFVNHSAFDFKILPVVPFFQSSFLFYAEYNIRLFLILIRSTMHIHWACDADTLLAGFFTKKIKKNKLIYDAHEYFEESPELVNKKFISRVWTAIQRLAIPHTDLRFSVSQTLCDELSNKYHYPFHLLRNVPLHRSKKIITTPKEKIILYQGVINIGRGIEVMIDAMEFLPDYKFWIIGDGDILTKLTAIATNKIYSDRIIFFGKKTPEELFDLTQQARIGINLLSDDNKNYYYSGANKTYDYIQAGIPSIQMNFPEYKILNEHYPVSILIDRLDLSLICHAVHQLEDTTRYQCMIEQCAIATKVFNWENEKKVIASCLSFLI